MVESRPGGGATSSDALMRWEWEGGTPAAASGQREGARAEPTSPLEQSQPLRESRKSWLLHCEQR
jgi:hypothetical protein